MLMRTLIPSQSTMNCVLICSILTSEEFGTHIIIKTAYQEEFDLMPGFEASLCCRRGLGYPELASTVMPTAHLLITDNVPI